MEKKTSSSKSREKWHSSKKNEEISGPTQNLKVEIKKRIYSSEETSTDESMSSEESRIQHSKLNFRATAGKNSRKESSSELELERIKPSSTESQEKIHSSKKNVERTSKQTKSSKGNTCKTILPFQETSSDELLTTEESQIQHSQINFPTTGKGSSCKKAVGESEMKRKELLSPNYSAKQHSSKKKLDGTLRQIKSNKGKDYKRMASSEELLSKSANAGSSRKQHDQAHSRASSEYICYKKKEMKLVIERKRPSSCKSQRKHRSLKENVKEISPRTEINKGKAYKRIASCEEVLSKSENAGSSQNQHDKVHSRASSEDSCNKGKERKLEIERKRPSSCKSWRKHRSLKKKFKETSQTEIGSGKTFKRIASCEENFSGKLMSPTLSEIEHDEIYSCASKKDKSCKASKKLEEESETPSYFKSSEKHFSKENGEETSQLTGIGKRNYKFMNYLEDNSQNESSNDNMPRIHLYSPTTGEDNKCMGASSSFPTLSIKNKRGNGYNKISNSKNSSSDDLCIDVNETDTEDNILKADDVLKESPRSPSLPNRLNLSESSNFSPFIYWGKNSKAMLSPNIEEPKIVDGAFTQNATKLVCKDSANKEWQKFKNLMIKHDKKKELSRCKTDIAESGSSHEREDAFKLINDEEDKKDASGNEDDLSVPNAPKEVNNDNEKKQSENINIIKKQIDVTEPGSSSFRTRWMEAFKCTKPNNQSNSDIEHKKDSSEVESNNCVRTVPKIVCNDNVKEESVKFECLQKQIKFKKKLSSSKMDGDESGCCSSFHCKRNDDFKSTKLISDMEHKKDCSEVDDDACTRNIQKLVNNNNVKKKVEKSLSPKKFEKKDLKSKIGDADKIPTYETSNENIADLNFSPVTPENKRVPKRRSDPSNALKENRQRPSI